MPTQRRPMAFLLALLALGAAHCGDDAPPGPSSGAPPGADGGPGGGEGGAVVEADLPLVPATKVDLLFMIDNSSTMADKQIALASSMSRVLRQLIEPTGGHAPIKDVHIGVISSSL